MSDKDREILSKLSSREIDVLAIMSTGATNPEISEVLGITENTVKRHIHNMIPAFPVEGRIRIILYALRSPVIVEAMSAAKKRIREAA